VELQKLRHCIWESQSYGICGEAGEAVESGFVFGNRKAMESVEKLEKLWNLVLYLGIAKLVLLKILQKDCCPVVFQPGERQLKNIYDRPVYLQFFNCCSRRFGQIALHGGNFLETEIKMPLCHQLSSSNASQ
jgi:hypothetical protein